MNPYLIRDALTDRDTACQVYKNEDSVDYPVGLFGGIEAEESVSGVRMMDSWLQGTYYVGGIAGLSLGKVKDCSFQGCVIASGQKIGGICGYGRDIVSCTNAGRVEGEQQVGGISGLTADRDSPDQAVATAQIKNCENTGEVVGNAKWSKFIGGICGVIQRYAIETDSVSVTGCVNRGRVTAEIGKEALTTSNINYVGGICGDAGTYIPSMDGSTDTIKGVTVEKCTNEAEITVDGSAVGGICGTLGRSDNETTYMINCRNTGTITGRLHGSVGGLCGWGCGGAKIKCSRNEGDVISSADDKNIWVRLGGICGRLDSTTGLQNCANTGAVQDKSTNMASHSIGGICGYMASADADSVQNCYSTGALAVSDTSASEVSIGGIYGSYTAGVTILACVKNSYYLEGCAGNQSLSNTEGLAKSEASFTSGEVTYLLSQGTDGTVWKQTLFGEGKDSTPSLSADSKAVYRGVSLKCDGSPKNSQVYAYSNSLAEANAGIRDAHSYKVCENDKAYHSCSVCGEEKVTHDYIYTVAEEGDAIQSTCSVCGATYTVRLTHPTATSGGEMIYDGTAKKIGTEIAVGSTGVETIPEDAITYAAITDNTVSDYSTTAPRDAGSYRAKLTLGTGDNAVSIETTFIIAKATPQIEWSEADKSQSLPYTGSEVAKDALKNPSIILQGDDSFNDWNKAVYSYRNVVNGVPTGDVFTGKLPTDVGTYEVKVSIPASDDDNYTKAVSEAMTLTITQAENKFISSIAYDGHTYEKGKKPTPSAEALFGEITYKYAEVVDGTIPTEDEKYSETPPTDAGTYAVKAYVQETKCYKELVSEPLLFRISSSSTTPNMPDKVKTLQPAKSVKTIGEILLPTDWSWSKEDSKRTLTDDTTQATAVYTGNDSGKKNYLTESVELNIQRSTCEHIDRTAEIEVDATCTTEGFARNVYCKTCNAFVGYREYIAALGHAYETPQYVWRTDDAGNVICTASKTCTRKGCTDAEEEHTVTETVTATVAETKKPTCTANGIRAYTAVFTKEGFAVQTKDEEIPATGHKLTFVASKEATATTAGNKAYFVCDSCGRYYEDSEGKTEIADKSSVVIPASGTTTPGGTGTPNPTPSVLPSMPSVKPTAAPSKATVQPAGTKIKDSTGATYKVTGTKSKTPTVQYMAPKKGTKGIVTIPATVTISKVSYKVTSIAANAFKNNKKITKVVIGNNIISIGKNAFAKCTKVTSITIGKNVTRIGKNAFAGCKNLKTITIKSEKLTMKSVAKGAFSGISKKTVVKAAKKKYKAYKKLLRAKGLSKKVRIKKY